MHRRGVMHRDINPANIVLSAATGPRAWSTSRWRLRSPRSVPGSRTRARSSARWPTWRRSRPGAPAGRWTSAPTCTRWAPRCTRLATGRPPFEARRPAAAAPRPSGAGADAAGAAERRPAAPLSDIIMRLLEKEPERRYQSAEGLAHDLARAAGRLAHGEPARFALWRARLPAAAVAAVAAGRPRAEIGGAAKRRSTRPLQGRCRGVLVAGAPGVGKTALINELRPMVTAPARLVRRRQVRPVPARPGVRRASRRRSARSAGCCWPSRSRSWRALRERHPATRSGQRRAGRRDQPEFALLLGVPPEVRRIR